MTEPELGQALFSNSDIFEHEVPRHVTYDLDELAERIGRSRGDWQFGWGAVTGNSGAEEYKNEVFAIRSYCWCDGELEGHAEACPPNFEHFASGLKINWYKHVRRGTTANQSISRSAWRKIIEECLESTGFSEEDVETARVEEAARCSSCERTQEELKAAVGFDGEDEVDSLKTTGKCRECNRRLWLKVSADVNEQLAAGERFLVGEEGN